MRIVVDTSVLVSALISDAGTPSQLRRAWLAKSFVLVMCELQFEELKWVLERPQFRKYVSRAEVGTFVNELRERAFVVESFKPVDVSPDENDNFLFGMALQAKAAFVVSVDRKHVLSLEKVGSIRVLSPAQFMAGIRVKRKKRRINSSRKLEKRTKT